jgi:GTP1/Obg family GTP-binding protein
MAQERIRGEMAKCEQAQQNIEKMMADLRTELERSNKKPNTLDIRRRLMEIRSCIGRYAKHIEALRADAKISEMPRINYNE